MLLRIKLIDDLRNCLIGNSGPGPLIHLQLGGLHFFLVAEMIITI